MKLRLKTKRYGIEERYIPQFKNFLLWRTFKAISSGGGFKRKMYFSDCQEAKLFLKDMKGKKVTSTAMFEEIE